LAGAERTRPLLAIRHADRSCPRKSYIASTVWTALIASSGLLADEEQKNSKLHSADRQNVRGRNASKDYAIWKQQVDASGRNVPKWRERNDGLRRGIGSMPPLEARMEAALRTSVLERQRRSPLLTELETAHFRLIEAIGQPEKLTDGPLPHRSELVDTRWQVSSASLSRRLLWSRILISLSRSAGPQDETALRRLQEIDIELLRASTKHVCAWTQEAVLNDWTGYRNASKTMLIKMKEAVQAEEEMFYPILNRLDL
jgi:hypothetical protein